MTVLDVLLFVLLLAACGAGVVLTLLQLPGTWLIALCTAGYAWHYDWGRIEARWVIVIAVMAFVAEVAESLGAAYLAKRGGASRRGIWYGLFGGILGAILLTVPVPIVGTIIGAALGCFVGTFAAEWSLDRAAADGAKAGVFAAAGRTLGSILKLMMALAMSGVAVAASIAALA